MNVLTKLVAAGFVAVVLACASANAQQIVTYYSSPNAYAVQQVTAPAPVVVYRPVVVAPTPVVVQRPVVVAQPVIPAPAPVAVTTYRPVVAAPAVPVTSYVPVPVTTTRYRPILGGAVQRTRVRYAPVTTYVAPW